jgi:hypothetical protein
MFFYRYCISTFQLIAAADGNAVISALGKVCGMALRQSVTRKLEPVSSDAPQGLCPGNYLGPMHLYRELPNSVVVFSMNMIRQSA